MLRDLFSLFPAHAGVIPNDEQVMEYLKAFPRTCGGDPKLKKIIPCGCGFSPHMRG